MKQLNKTQTILFMAGGALMVIGAGLFSFLLVWPVACWVFLVGALLFAVIQGMQTYDGQDLTLRRLKRIQQVADLFFVLAGIDMVDTVYGFFRPLFSSAMTYGEMIYNKWVILLLIAAILEVYTVHRMDHELSKKNIKE